MSNNKYTRLNKQYDMRARLEKWSKMGFWFSFRYVPNKMLPWVVCAYHNDLLSMATAVDNGADYKTALGGVLWRLEHGAWEGAQEWAKANNYKFKEI